MTVDPRRLLVLASVRRSGGVLAAARILHLTPSAVSQQIARLEAEVHAAVLDRARAGGGRAASLTPVGELLAARGDELAAVLARTERDLAALTGAHGRVRIGAFPTAIRRLVAPALTACARDHPALVPEVLEVDETSGTGWLRQGTLDVLLVERDPVGRRPAARTEGRGSAALVARELLVDPFQVVVPAVWPRPDDADRLLRGAWVAGPAGSAARSALDALAASTRLPPPVPAHTAMEYPAVLALVAAGLGAAVVPTLALGYTAQPGVRTATPAVDAGHRRLVALTRTGEPRAVESLLLDALAAAADGTGAGG